MAVKLIDKLKVLFTSDWDSISILLSQLHSGLLIDEGWIKSYKLKKAVDKNLQPIPWTTYSFIDFIKPRLTNSMKIFEYGSGNSTLFFASRVGSVTSAEHNEKWYNEITRQMPSNVKLLLNTINTFYINSISNENTNYDLIFIDGIDRNECIVESIRFLKDNGVIVLDDSEREEYQKGKMLLNENDFKVLEFWGIAPGVLFKKCTSVYYRSNNCMNI